MMKRIIEVGLNHDMPDYIKKRIVPTNIITLLLLFIVATPFTIITLIFLPPLWLFPGAGIITCIGVLIANSLGGIKYSRFFVAALPVYEICLYNAYIRPPGETPIVGFFLIALGFVMVTLLVFDLREIRAIIFTGTGCAVPIIFWPLISEVLTLSPEQLTEAAGYIEMLKTGWLNYVTVTAGVIVAYGSMVGLAFINKGAEKESEMARSEAEEKNKALESQQKELEENLKKVEEAQAEEKKRNWAIEGIANIAEILRSNKDSEEIFDNTISMIVNYTKSNQGGLFIVDRNEIEAESKAKIKLQSCYAYSRKKYMEQEYEEGQGLVGQAYLEGEYIHMTKIPTNYINITSGLGEATPSSLLIMPLKVNDIIEGIIEIAAFSTYEDYQIEFIEKLGENIASYIQTNRINERTNKLLKEAQEQSEELRAQEEEMRQNMEELSATQEELSRKENEYQKVIADLKKEVETLTPKSQAKTATTQVN
ncbi:hypothetical protein QQ020_25375 [Fulvivirgaceae bacterium BMA12]|uniref:GAF domain-containing protein n=1 Tax=Agaribacillus aureus TaxID=3051825 RepID=A0ABT8LGD6_9BACT|nr:hypothetical protein [Fulvivirgaceae bacterium BMA12]